MNRVKITNCCVRAAASVVGKMEKAGPLGAFFDLHDNEDRFGQTTWEKAEAEMQRMALNTALAKAKWQQERLGAIFAGDLLNQCVGAAYGLKDFCVPYLGLYGACSTAAEGLLLTALLCDRGVFSCAAAVASSHNCTAERQYRSPLEYGAQRTPTAQWTVTGAGAFLVDHEVGEDTPLIRAVMPGTVIEKGVRDAANMGAAMAPAAADTLLRFFEETHTVPGDFDLIVTGDLGQVGKELLMELARKDGLSLGGKLTDCGNLIFDNTKQDVHAGGSGCGCSAITLCAEFLPKLASGKLKKILFCGTGALLSPTSTQQGLPIPGVCHAVVIEGER